MRARQRFITVLILAAAALCGGCAGMRAIETATPTATGEAMSPSPTPQVSVPSIGPTVRAATAPAPTPIATATRTRLPSPPTASAAPSPVPRFTPAPGALHGLVYYGRGGIFIVEDTGTGTPTFLVHESGASIAGVLVSRSRELLYTQTGQDLWVVNVRTGDRRQLIEGPLRDQNADIMVCKWSPDGEWVGLIIGMMRPVISNTRASLYTIRVSTGETRKVAERAGYFSWLEPTGELVYEVDSEERHGLGVVSPDGSGDRLLYRYGYDIGLPGNPGFLVTSPRDGSVLLHVGVVSNKWLMIDPTDGSVVDLHDRYKGPKTYLEWTAFSPDGKSISFVDQEGLGVFDVESGTARILSKDFFRGGVWSPDGTLVTAQDGKSLCWIRVSDGMVEGCIEGEGWADVVAWY